MISTLAPTVSIRGWERKDIPQLAVLSGELGYTSTEAQVEERLAQMGADTILLGRCGSRIGPCNRLDRVGGP